MDEKEGWPYRIELLLRGRLSVCLSDDRLVGLDGQGRGEESASPPKHCTALHCAAHVFHLLCLTAVALQDRTGQDRIGCDR